MNLPRYPSDLTCQNYQPGGVFKSQDSRAILAKSLSKSAIAWSSESVPHRSGELSSHSL